MFKGFKNSNIYVEGKGIKKTSVEIKGELIHKIGCVCGKDFIELPDNLFVVPGFIDEHIHGSNGYDVMNTDQKTLEIISKSLLQDGVTCYCATTMTMDNKKINSALENVEKYIDQKNNKGAKIIGVHLEGPFINKNYKGAQPEKAIVHGTLQAFRNFYNICPSIRIATIAYENCDDDMVVEMSKCGVTPSIGHADCTNEKLLKGIELGISCSTHTYNCQRPLHHRDIGTVGTVLSDERVYCELICDFIHVSKEAVKFLYKCKGKDKIVLVTDSMEAKHLKDGIYQIGGQKVIVKGDEARLKSGNLAGSMLTTNKAIYNIKNLLNLSLEDAVDMATINPARNLHMDDIIGSIKKGKRANFTVVDENLKVYMTVVEGEIRYRKGI